MSKDHDPSPWYPESDPVALAVLGKALEEIFELIPLLEMPPPRGKTLKAGHFQHLAEELADVDATLHHVMGHYGLVIPSLDGPELRDPHRLSGAPVDRAGAMYDLGKAISRVLIQGIDENEPRTGESNRLILQRHVWNAMKVVTRLTHTSSAVDPAFVRERADRKIAYLGRWHEGIRIDNSSDYDDPDWSRNPT